jgi:hypothetical protein
MIDIRRRLVFLRLRFPAADFPLERFEAGGICFRTIPWWFADFSTRQRSRQLRGISARVVYNGGAPLQKSGLKRNVKALRNPVLR